MGKQLSRATDTEIYLRARARVRHRPAWWLRRIEARIITTEPVPSREQLALLSALRRELLLRGHR